MEPVANNYSEKIRIDQDTLLDSVIRSYEKVIELQQLINHEQTELRRRLQRYYTWNEEKSNQILEDTKITLKE